MKSANEIRSMFFDFFREKGHTIVESAPVVPHNDPTLLFTNAGMNQFKDIFLGTGQRDYVRAADTQKCVRVSGKHNDLEEVGIDTYHHTFFEMLGNWSFGDYFKEEAISWAWEFLTRHAGLNPDIMYATVFEGDPDAGVEADNEAAAHWVKHTSIPSERVLFCSAKDNFWEMGDTGPCGPCTEIHVDRGPDACDMKGVQGHICKVNGDCARYIEIWNLVFIQYNRLPDGSLEPLPARHVDTGMGFERLVSIMQGKLSNYDTDLFSPLFSELTKLSGHTYGTHEAKDIAFRVIADHARTLSIAITDGVNPGNVGRGYVLRRILRRAVRYGRQTLGLTEPFMPALAGVCATIYSEIFPEIGQRLQHISQVLLSEENAFARTIDNGIKKFEELAERLAGDSASTTLPGAEAFDLYSTFGFPKDLIELMARERSLTLDEEGWAQAETDHEAASAGKKRVFAEFNLEELEGLEGTTFTGYADATGAYHLSHPTTALRMVNDNTILILKETPFYAESGGQVGDAGVINILRDGQEHPFFNVTNTKKLGDYTLHHGHLATPQASVQLPAPVVARVDTGRRTDIMANHTATHILHWALREVLGDHATQQGSAVEPEKLRFDFTHHSKLTEAELAKIERLVNRQVMRTAAVENRTMAVKEAKESGAMAIFGEKYGETVRVVSVGGFSKELCGGTHLTNAGEIGSFYITEEAALSAGVRRIVAITRMRAYEHAKSMEHLLNSLSLALKTPRDQLEEKIERLLETNAKLKAEGAKKEAEGIKTIAQKMVAGAQKINETLVITAHMPDLNRKQAAELTDLIRSFNITCGGVLVVDDAKGKVAIVTFASKGHPSLHAGNLLKELAPIIGGRGGGRPDFAQGGGTDIEKIPQLLAAAREKFAQLLE